MPPRWHAVLNHESGVTHGNEVGRIADATGKGAADEVQRKLREAHERGVRIAACHPPVNPPYPGKHAWQGENRQPLPPERSRPFLGVKAESVGIGHTSVAERDAHLTPDQPD